MRAIIRRRPAMNGKSSITQRAGGRELVRRRGQLQAGAHRSQVCSFSFLISVGACLAFAPLSRRKHTNASERTRHTRAPFEARARDEVVV